ncbi:MAG: hypothetical protein LBT00_06555 [Spirochaetaceae bacterium]|jgi:hypothetical protein|nr:hypothetical protein [Spirochaetaceae bacterium]
MIKVIRYAFVLPAWAYLFVLFSCEQPVVEARPSPTIKYIDASIASSVTPLSLSSVGEGDAVLSKLNQEDVFLVMVNTGGSGSTVTVSSANAVSGEASGVSANRDVSGVSANGDDGRVPAGFITIDGETLVRYERQIQITPPSSLPNKSLRAMRSVVSDFASAQAVGDTKQVYADVSPTVDVPTLKTATLKKIGTHCKIWVVNSNFGDSSQPPTGDTPSDNKINQTQINDLADKFDTIYPLETNLLGYENGGGPGGNRGMDGDSHIQILVCDIDGDFGNHPNGITMGYFYAVDEYENEVYYYSNEAEIFYLDAEMLDKEPDTAYSTLIHEFNHMINFNVKVLQQGNKWSNWESWYTEMLSMLAEDVIGPLVGIDYDPSSRNGNVINERIPYWLYRYASAGVMQWDNGNPLPYYESNYAFGAYLVRNFGGPELLSAIAQSSLGGKASLDAALKAHNGNHATAQYALSRFGEALVYSGTSKPAGVYSFDKTVSGTVGSTNYTFPAFDIWTINPINGQSKLPYTGPITSPYPDNASIPASGIQMFRWENQTGGLTIRIRNGSSNIHYYVMIKTL